MGHLILLIIILFFCISFLSLAPWVPTRSYDLQRIHSLIKLRKNQKFLEIWCWNARVSLYLAKHNPQSSITWIEMAPWMYLISKLRAYLSGLNNIEIIYWNALKHDMNGYDVLYVFWLPDTVSNKLFPILKNQMKKTARFYSYCFRMRNNYFHEIKHKPEWQYSVYEYQYKVI